MRKLNFERLFLSFMPLMIMIIIVFCYSDYGFKVKDVSAANTFLTEEQILNSVYDTTETSLKIKGTINTAETSNYTIMKRYTLTPNVDSGDNLSFGTIVNSWTIVNVSENDIFIKLESAATTNDVRIPKSASLNCKSKATTIHAISADTSEVQVIGLY